MNITQSTFKRRTLTITPVFDIKIGNLTDCVQKIETFLLKQRGKDVMKATIPFIMIINPPRHGKSLLLDMLFSDPKFDDDVLVLALSYNSGTPFMPRTELQDTATALHFFWLRVLHTLVNARCTLSVLDEELMRKSPGLKLRSFSDVVQVFKTNALPHFINNPLKMMSSDGVEKMRDVFILVDEFSLLTDHFVVSHESCERIEGVDAREFMNSLEAEKRLSPHILQFVFTGFTARMKRVVPPSAVVLDWFSIPLCDFSASRPLLKRIAEEYHRRDLAVPNLLFQSVKMSSGLIGQWAELIVREETLVPSLNAFRDAVQWLHNLGATDERRRDLWDLLVQYLLCSEKKHSELDSLIRDRLENSPVFCSKGFANNDLFIPICFVIVTRNALKMELASEEERLLRQWLCGVFESVDKTPFQMNKTNNGKEQIYDDFVFLALRIRVLLRKMLESSSFRPHTLNVHSFFPGDAWRLRTNGSHWTGSEQEIMLHTVSSKEHLRKFLLPPLFSLFPVSCTTEYRTNMAFQAWVSAPSEDRSVTPCVELDCDVDLSAVVEIHNDVMEKHISFVFTKKGLIEEHLYSAFFAFVSACRENRSLLEDASNIGSASSSWRSLMHEFIEQHPMQSSKEITIWWDKIIIELETVVGSFGQEKSFIRCTNSGRGTGLIITWQDDLSLSDKCMLNWDDEESSTEERVYHVAAIELNASANTKIAKEWDTKMHSLLLHRCVFWWLKALYPTETLKFHVVFADAEESRT